MCRNLVVGLPSKVVRFYKGPSLAALSMFLYLWFKEHFVYLTSGLVESACELCIVNIYAPF